MKQVFRSGGIGAGVMRQVFYRRGALLPGLVVHLQERGYHAKVVKLKGGEVTEVSYL